MVTLKSPPNPAKWGLKITGAESPKILVEKRKYSWPHLRSTEWDALCTQEMAVNDISNNNLDFNWVDPQIDSPKFSLKQEWKNKDWQKFKEAT